MKNQSLIAKFHPHILGLFSAIFVVIPLYTTMAILAWVAYLLIGGILKSIQFKWNWKMSLWIGLYLLYVIGSFFTDHSDIAGKYLEDKLSFVSQFFMWIQHQLFFCINIFLCSSPNLLFSISCTSFFYCNFGLC